MRRVFVSPLRRHRMILLSRQRASVLSTSTLRWSPSSAQLRFYPQRILNIPTIVARVGGRDQSKDAYDFAGLPSGPSGNAAAVGGEPD